MTTIYDVIRRPIVTEKSNHQLNKLHQYAFEVDRNATKDLVKQAVETLFNVNVIRINVINMPAKRGKRARSRRELVRRSGYKKALVTLADGDRIEMFEGVR